MLSTQNLTFSSQDMLLHFIDTKKIISLLLPHYYRYHNKGLDGITERLNMVYEKLHKINVKMR